MRRIYLDHAATTPLLPVAREAMLPWLDSGNPSSLYQEGRRAKDAIDQARESLSGALGCLFAEVIFTSSGTEAANLAILGAALANENHHRSRILLGAAEHHCVLHTAHLLERLGYRVELLPVDRCGRVQVDDIGDDVLLVSVMHANNELGTINDLASISALARARGAILHCDAVQSFMSVPWGVNELGADLVSVSAHKVNGPKGSGALYVKAGTRLKPLMLGGGQERELRAGTENVAAIVGFGAAVREHTDGISDNRISARARFLEVLDGGYALTVPSPERPGTAIPCLPGHLHLRYPGIDAETMLIVLDRLGVSASSGSACSSGSLEPSHVLRACGYSPSEAKEGLRFTFGKGTTDDEATEAAERVNDAARRLTGGRGSGAPSAK